MIPSGTGTAWGSSVSSRANSLDRKPRTSRPASSTEPAVGVRRRASVRNSVDLPQAFGPTMIVILPCGISTLRSCETTRWS